RSILRSVSIIFNASAKLKCNPFERDLLQAKNRKRILNDIAMDQSFFSVGRVVTPVSVEPKRARKAAISSLIENATIRKKLISEEYCGFILFGRTHFFLVKLHFGFALAVVAVIESEFHAFDE